MLAGCLQPRARYAGTAEDRYAKFDALGIDGIHLLVVDWDLGECSRGKHADGPGPEGLVLADEAIDPRHTLVGIGARRRDEPIGESLQRLGTRAGRVTDADQPLLDSPEVHFPHRHGDRVVDVLQGLLGNVFEHVLDREVEFFLGLGVPGLSGNEPIDLLHVPMGESQHGVDRTYALGHDHPR